MKPPAASKPKEPPKPPKDRPHCERGDEIYFHHEGQPFTGKVLSKGEHGATVELKSGTRHQMRWENYLGHRTRTQPELSIVDQGEDGFVARAPGGRPRFIHDPLDEGEDGEEDLGKAFDGQALGRILDLQGEPQDWFSKAIKGGAGLALQDVTTKDGTRTKRWKRTGGDQAESKPAPKAPQTAVAKPAAAGPPPGHHDAKAGQTVKFRAGAFHGEGKIVGKPGPKGVHVQDHTGRMHKIAWDEIHERDGQPASPGPRLVVPTRKPAKAASSAPEAAKPEAKAASPEPKAPSALAAAGGAGGDPPDQGDRDFFTPEETADLPRKAAQPFKTWEDLEAHGEAAHEEFATVLKGVGKKLGLRTDLATPEELTEEHLDNADGYLFLGPLKTKERAQRKVDGEYDGDWSKVTDMIRATISVSTFEEVHQAVAAVKAAGLQLAQRPKDKFSEPTHAGYRDLMTIVKLPNGMLAELQYHLKPITAAKAVHHHDYAEMGTLQAKYGEESPSAAWSEEDHAAFHASVKRQRDGYNAAWKKAGGTD